MAFDSNAYLAKNSGSSGGGFDPAKYLADNKEHVDDSNDFANASIGDRVKDLFTGQKMLGAAIAKAKAEKEQHDFLPEGSKDKPVETDIFGSEGDRMKSSFGDTKGVGKMLLSKGFVDFDRNKDGDLVAKDSSGTWHKDATGFMSHPINWAESGAGKALPLAGGIGAAALAAPSGPGAIGAAAAGGAGGEALRSTLGRGMGVYDGDMDDQALDAGKEALTMGAGEGLGKYAVKPAMEAMGPSLRAGARSIGEGLGNIGTKIGSALTKVPESDIKTYFEHSPEAEALYKANDGNTQDMADQVRGEIGNRVQQYRRGANDQITKALETAPKDPVEITPVLDKLKAIRDKINPDLNPEGVKDIQTLIDRIEKTSDMKKNSVIGYDAPNEKAVTIAHDFAAGGPQKQFILHEPGEVIKPQGTEVISDLPGQSGQRSVPVIDTEPSVLGEHGMPSAGAQDILGNKTISRAGVDRNAEDMLGNPDFGGVKSVVDSGMSPDDSLVELPIQGRPTYYSPLTKLHDITKFLQDQAAPAYGNSPLGFKVGDAGANAAKGGAAVGRDLMNQLAETSPNAEAITGANAKLSRLHDVEDVMNKNLLEEGKTASSLFAGGSGNNPQVSNSLRDLGNEIGHDVLGDAQKLSAARTFGGTPELLPLDTTGKSLTRVGTGALAGAAAGSLFPGVGTVIGGAVGAAMTSPAMLKIGIKTAQQAAQFAQSPLVQSAMSNPRIIQTIANPALRSAVQSIVDQLKDGDQKPDEGAQYDPLGQKAQPTEVAKQKFLQGN